MPNDIKKDISKVLQKALSFEEGMKHFRDIFIQAMKQQGFSDETIVMIMQACEKQDI
ncbi:MAG: hypothetical protein IKX48_01740 [Victivallales bacterium]|nr:hypothetical protein [Victivallales bacterium]